jgi:hypothetical protein
MGWKGALRSINAASRRASREAVRRQKEFDRRQAQLSKLMQREQDALEVEEFENYLEVLRSVHRDCAEPVDWRSLAERPEPPPPLRSDAAEARARQALAAYVPGFFDRLFARVELRRRQLAGAIERAKAADDAGHARAVAEHAHAHQEWADMRELARRILASNREAELEALEQLDPFREMSELGSEITFTVPENGPIHAEILVNGEDVIPSHTKTLLQSGKLSIKKMPVGQFYEIYQDYVCGCVLRTARELFAALPVDAVIVTAKGEVLNTANGHVEVQPIVSAAIPRRTLVRLNFDALDPSDSLRNFTHRMEFKKTKGFLPVRRIAPSEVTLH